MIWRARQSGGHGRLASQKALGGRGSRRWLNVNWGSDWQQSLQADAVLSLQRFSTDLDNSRCHARVTKAVFWERERMWGEDYKNNWKYGRPLPVIGYDGKIPTKWVQIVSSLYITITVCIVQVHQSRDRRDRSIAAEVWRREKAKRWRTSVCLLQTTGERKATATSNWRSMRKRGAAGPWRETQAHHRYFNTIHPNCSQLAYVHDRSFWRHTWGASEIKETRRYQVQEHR